MKFKILKLDILTNNFIKFFRLYINIIILFIYK